MHFSQEKMAECKMFKGFFSISTKDGERKKRKYVSFCSACLYLHKYVWLKAPRNLRGIKRNLKFLFRLSPKFITPYNSIHAYIKLGPTSGYSRR